MIHYTLLLAPEKMEAPLTGKRQAGRFQTVLFFLVHDLNFPVQPTFT
jgi:hypothetical protein